MQYKIENITDRKGNVKADEHCNQWIGSVVEIANIKANLFKIDCRMFLHCAKKQKSIRTSPITNIQQLSNGYGYIVTTKNSVYTLIEVK